MWTCPRCGEQHGDQFTECWKCVGADAQAQSAATPLPAAHPEPRLRPLSAVLKRAFIGFCVGAVITMLFANFIDIRQIHASWPDLSLLGTSFLSLIVGFMLGAFVGVFVWVVFPYEPTNAPTEKTDGESS